MSLGRLLFWLGLSFVAVGLILQLAPQIPWLGKLPGDIRIERPGFSFTFPLTTCILISVVLTLLANLFARLR
ncbi:MAG TPA: DUF2905 domain-containing protein [Myxococcota bacterium]|nr:DUF2905 domain-containing protein [Myxococcota bacterium]